MASKKSLLGGVTLKVENMSGFDKSRYNAFTAPLGAIVPMVKQLCLPGKAKLSVKISATLPPLAADAFLRTHLKLEAFFVPMRLCYGGFQSWFSGEPITTASNPSPVGALTRAKLPRLVVHGSTYDEQGVETPQSQLLFDEVFGPHSLMDYFGVKLPLSSGHVVFPSWSARDASDPDQQQDYTFYNIFPLIAYQLCYHHWYRNKLIERPLFAPPASNAISQTGRAAFLPYLSHDSIADYVCYLSTGYETIAPNSIRNAYQNIRLLNGHLLQLRQRNYGFDYFTTALPSAQDGQPMTVDTSAGSFTISALRVANAGQHFAEINQVAGPDYVQVMRARYNRAPSSAVASKPVLLGSADFPMYTSGVEQTAPFDSSSAQTRNPFEGVAARYGRAHAEGSDFVCEAEFDEPGYFMVMASVVPEANYAVGTDKDMRLFTQEGSIVDLPCAELERVGMEPVYREELTDDDSSLGSGRYVFGYQPRYTHHKAGQVNEVHGLFRQGASLESFIPQRYLRPMNANSPLEISTRFLKVNPTDLDGVTAVSGAISEYGVMIDSAVSLYVSEPLGESVMPSLVDPAAEHGQSVYVKRGGVSVDH